MKVNAERQVIIIWKHYQTRNNIMLSMKQHRKDKLQPVKYCLTSCSQTVTTLGDKPNLRPALTVPTTVYVKHSTATSAPRLHNTIKTVSELSRSSKDSTQSRILNIRQIGALRSLQHT